MATASCLGGRAATERPDHLGVGETCSKVSPGGWRKDRQQLQTWLVANGGDTAPCEAVLGVKVPAELRGLTGSRGERLSRSVPRAFYLTQWEEENSHTQVFNFPVSGSQTQPEFFSPCGPRVKGSAVDTGGTESVKQGGLISSHVLLLIC